MRPVGWPRRIEVVVGSFLVLMLLSEALLFLPPLHPTIAADVTIRAETNTYFVNSTFTVPYASDFEQTYLWEPSGAPQWHLFYYYDATYSRLSDIFKWYGLPAHVSTVAGYRSVGGGITPLDSTQLASFLSAPPAPNDVLLVVPGFLPPSVALAKMNLLRTWVGAGGSLLWTGDLLGYNVASSPEGLSSTRPANDSGWNGTSRFFPPSWVLGGGLPLPGGGANRNAAPALPAVLSQRSFLSQALGIDYPNLSPSSLFNTSNLPSTNGTQTAQVLGNQYAHWTNALRFSLGNGTVVDFAGPIPDLTPLSIWVMNLLEAGLLTEQAQVLGSASLVLSAGSTSTSASVVVPSSLARSGSLCVLTVQTDYDMPFGELTCSP